MTFLTTVEASAARAGCSGTLARQVTRIAASDLPYQTTVVSMRLKENHLHTTSSPVSTLISARGSDINGNSAIIPVIVPCFCITVPFIVTFPSTFRYNKVSEADSNRNEMIWRRSKADKVRKLTSFRIIPTHCGRAVPHKAFTKVIVPMLAADDYA